MSIALFLAGQRLSKHSINNLLNIVTKPEDLLVQVASLVQRFKSRFALVLALQLVFLPCKRSFASDYRRFAEPVLEDFIIEINQIFERSREEHPRYILRSLVKLHSKEVRSPLQVLHLCHLRATLEHKVVALASGALLHHQQPQLILLV